MSSKLKENAKSSKVKVNTTKYLFIGGIFAILILVAPFIYYDLVLESHGGLDKTGLFGDSFGALSSVFSGLAFLGLIITIAMQMDELRLTREEYHLNRVQFEKSVDAQNKAQKALNDQLELLRMTSSIQALQSYIELPRKGSQSDNDKVFIASRIIESLVEGVVKAPQFLDITKPHFIKEGRLSVSTPGHSQPLKLGLIVELRIAFKNIGTRAVGVNIPSLLEGFQLVVGSNNTHRLIDNEGLIQLNYSGPLKEEYVMTLFYQAHHVKSKWGQIIKITFKEGELSYTISYHAHIDEEYPEGFYEWRDLFI